MASGHTLSGPTLVIGLNAALQKRFVLPPTTPLVPGNVHRAVRVEEGVGGKGQDVAVSLSCLSKGEEGGVYLAQFIGTGPEGDAVLGLLRERVGTNADVLTVRTRTKLRTCTSVVGADCTTELIEPSGTIEKDEMEELSKKTAALVRKKGSAGALVVMGSMPPGCSPHTYATLYETAAGDGTLLLVDSVAGLNPLLNALSCHKRAWRGGTTGRGRDGFAMLKLNASELSRLAGLTTKRGEAEGVPPDEVRQAVDGFVTGGNNGGEPRVALDYMALTDGRHPGYLVCLDTAKEGRTTCRIYKIKVPDLSRGKGKQDDVNNGPQHLYPIGAGDSVAAGTVAAWRHFYHQRPDEWENNDGPLLGKDVVTTLSDRLSEFESAIGEDANNGSRSKMPRGDFTDDASVALAFAFGLACGSASCLERENSVFEVKETLRLFCGMEVPTKVY